MKRLFLTLSVVILTGITGCDFDSSTRTVDEIIKTGVFLDNEVAGISYQTETQSGVTGPGGEYQYKSGETITFSVGGISLPTALAQAILTPLGLVGTANTNNITVLNIVKLLLSVDEDGDSSNGIQVSERAHAFAAGMSVDFNSSSFDSDVTELVANSGSVNTELIDDATAMAHLEATIASLETAPDIFTHQWLSEKTLYSVRYSTSDKVSVVKQLEFNVGATTMSEMGLLNSNANEVISVVVSAKGLLHETSNPIQGRKVVCENSDQYVKTHIITNGRFNTVDLLFFDETQALEFAGTLTENIPPCSFEINPTENRAPVANRDSVTVNEDTVINLTVLGNDFDADGDTITINSATASNGIVTIEPDNTLTYIPNLNYNGSDNIGYIISDGQGGIANSIVTMTITPVNDAPLAIIDTSSTNEDITININVLANDSDADGDTLSISAASASNGMVNIASDNSLNYTPNSNFNGSDTINYSLSDGAGGTATSTVAVTISIVNDTPVAVNDTASTNEDTLVSIFVLANDSDVEGDTLTVLSTSASNGTATLVSGTSINYIPNANFNGTDTVNYTISDGSNTASATVTISIAAVNDAPIAVADTETVVEDTSKNIIVLANDSDVDGDTLSVTSVTATNGITSIGADNSINYTPNSNYFGSDTITYVLSDGALTASTTVGITVTNINDNPVAVADTASTNEDTLVSISVLSNDSDSDGDTLTISSASASNGTVTIEADETLTYTPSLNYNGTDTINYAINDGSTGTNNSTVTVTIVAINDDPVAVADSATVNEDTLVNLNVLVNDTDVDGNSLSIVSASAPNGTVTIEPDNTLNYTPTLNFNGSDNISYTISDGQAGAASSIVAMTITPVNDAPVANSDDATINEDSLSNINILSNDTDLEDDTLTVTVVTASNGDVSINPNQTLDYLPNPNFNGTDTINYTISDGTLTSDSTVNLIITAINDAPIISPMSTSIAENSANATPLITMIGSDVDTGDTLTYSIFSNSDFIFGIDSSSGQLSIADNTSLNYEIAVRHEVVIKVEDSEGLSNTAIATVDVTNVVENVTPTLDATFGTSGTAGSNAFASDHFDQPRASVIDASGKLVVVGKNDWSGPSTDIFIARFNTDGTLDRSFGHQGVVNQDLEAEEEAVAVAIDSAGRIVVTGIWILGGTQEIFVARFTPTGELDTSFNTTGYRITTYGAPIIAADLKITVDDSILVASSANSDGFRLLKFASDGTYIGYASADFYGGPDIATDMVLQSDGKVVITGTVFNDPIGYDFATARFDISLSFLDTSYHQDGKATFDLGNSDDDISFDAHITSDDEIVMVGSTIPSGGNRADMAALKIDSNGDLISGFGTSGLLIVDIDGDGDGTSNQSIGKAVTSDASGNLYFAIDKGMGNIDTVIYKTDANGSPVSGYGTAGQVTFDHNSSENIAEAILIDSSNKAVLLTTTTINIEPDAVVARFTPTGALDTSFNTDGFNSLDPTYTADTLNEMIELTTAPHAGKFVAVGTSGSEGGSKLIVARYHADGSQDETFGSNGYYVHISEEATITGQDIVELTDGKLVAVGTFDGEGLVLMIKSDGTLETSFASGGEKKLNGEGFELILNAVAIDNSNKIVIGGNDADDIYLARMELTGILDNTFATDGVAVISLFDTTAIADIAVLSDNAIIAVGQKGNYGLVAKINSTGALDISGFASGDGYVSQDLDPDSGTNVDILKRVKIKSDGKIVVAGYSTSAEPNNILVQFNSNGTLDTTFSNDGIASHNYGVGTAQTLALALDASDNILLTGFNSNGSNDDIFVARVTATGNKDTLFNNTGGKLFDYTGAEAATAILVRSDGTLVIAGADNLNLFPTNFFFLQKLNLIEP